MKIIACTQRDDEWRALRLGRLTSSRAAAAFATIKSGPAAGRRNLVVQLVLERLTNRSQENGYSSPDMERGVALEDDARAAYEAETGIVVTPVGFIAHDTLLAGCSPDGLTEDGSIEIKAPKAATHLEYLRGAIPLGYRQQIRHLLWLTGQAWCDFASFHPDFPEPLRLKVTRVLASEFDFADYQRQVGKFLSECDAEYDALVGALTV